MRTCGSTKHTMRELQFGSACVCQSLKMYTNEPWYKGGIVQMATTLTTQTMYMVPPHPLNSEQYKVEKAEKVEKVENNYLLLNNFAVTMLDNQAQQAHRKNAPAIHKCTHA